MSVIVIHGAQGYMGREVLKLLAVREPDLEPVLVDRNTDCEQIWPSLNAWGGVPDCIIDFSHHSATADLTAYAVKTGAALVIATTGQTPDELALIREAAERVPVFLASNMSMGIAVLIKMAKTAAAAFPEADIELVEIHHNRKLDVPSGTALTIANALCEVRPSATVNVGRHENGKRPKGEIGVHSLRMGNVVGVHEVHICTASQTLTLRHEAHDRSLFAEGALAAAAFVEGRAPGLYTMNDLLKEGD